MEEFFKQMSSYISEYGFKFLLAICIVVIGISIAWIIGFLLKKILLKTKIDGAMNPTVITMNL